MTSNAEEAEVEQFYEDLQDLLELTLVILEPKKIKFLTVSIVSPSICQEVIEPDAIILGLLMLSFKPAFHSPLSLSSSGSLVLLAFCHKGGVICISEVIDISPSKLDSSLC